MKKKITKDMTEDMSEAELAKWNKMSEKEQEKMMVKEMMLFPCR